MQWQVRIGCAVAVVALLAGQAAAQLPTPPKADGANRQRRLTDEQIREVLLLRALQTRGRSGGVKRGVPQFVPYPNPWFMANPVLPAQQAAGNGADGKRAQTQAARAERLRQAREKTVAEREEAVRQRAKARAGARAKAAKARVRAKDAKNDPG